MNAKRSDLAVSQAEAQDRITRDRIERELDKNFIVEAAAGTGKTTSLVNRMVALVETGTCRIDQLAAVTFTRKAAAELRERFQAALRKRANCSAALRSGDSNDPDRQIRLSDAADRVNRAFVGTIHSFCAALLRERPIEFGVDPAFRELDENEDFQIREQAWRENIADLIAVGDPLLDQLRDLSIDRAQLKACFDKFVEYRDIQDWPATLPTQIDVDDLRRRTQAYVEDMKLLISTFPVERGKEELMGRYEEIVRASGLSWSSLGRFFALLERFESKKKATQKIWAAAVGGSTKLGKAHSDRWEDFRISVAEPGLEYWSRFRYSFVVDFLRRAVSVYERLKQANGGLNFQDLLLIASRGLQNQPEMRTYFQRKYCNLLVDEFQDTDPLQAQMMLYLTASDSSQVDWTLCIPNPGSLFLVGDPKQSIYRFRRGDIITYNKVKEIICKSDGEVLPLVKNFRSRTELREWNNRVYSDKFGTKATPYSPAAEDMVQGRVDLNVPSDLAKALCGTYRLELPTDQRIAEVRLYEADAIARFIRHAIDSGIQVPRSQKELDFGRALEVEPRDFLIIPWGKKSNGVDTMHVFTDALQRYCIPYQVSGGNPLFNSSQLANLIDCLRAIDDPTNPVHYLTVLRELFGFSDRDLYQLKHSGGNFNYNLPVPDSLNGALRSRFQSVADRMWDFQIWMRSLPYATAVSQIATALGSFAAAASTGEGDMQSGGLFKVIERLRSQSWDFDSATDLIQFMEETLATEDADACPALATDGNVVRIMNLHKAKGLEAPIVFLADTRQKPDRKPVCYIDRRSGAPIGYMGIAIERDVQKKIYKTKKIATPENWSGLQDEERRFLNAEHDRLLYVATTRAACATIVSVGSGSANWASLYSYLDKAPALEIPERDPPMFGDATAIVDANTISQEQITAKWSATLTPSYAITTAKKLGLKGKTRPSWEVSGDYGHAWGSAVHELLEICHKSPTVDLRATALRLVKEYDLGIHRVDEVVTTAQSVAKSEIWNRAQASARCYSELPFETTATVVGMPTIIRGIIDLIFEEANGWVIVDYKTDDLNPKDVQEATEFYRGQLEQYSYYWQDMTSLPIAEMGLYFTRTSDYARL
ncbi:MAG: UvrD-helicase domain-containing protein [Pirellulaceae bacterium]|nr:UvrD-helicase domain-containing protein [Pirellulaceae bacterium]